MEKRLTRFSSRVRLHPPRSLSRHVGMPGRAASQPCTAGAVRANATGASRLLRTAFVNESTEQERAPSNWDSCGP